MLLSCGGNNDKKAPFAHDATLKTTNYRVQTAYKVHYQVYVHAVDG